MEGNTLVAVYGSRSEAERVRDTLVQIGVPRDEIRLSDGEGSWDWLFGSQIPDSDRNWFQTNLRQGRTAVAVLAKDDDGRERLTRTLDDANPIKRDQAAQGAGPGAGEQTKREGEQVIPVVKEELDVGKRTSESSYRIHAYVVEKPVEQEVRLRDERVVVEHRPLIGEQARGNAELPQEREFEVVERREEPVVGKRAHQTEEVVVGRETSERTEKVQDSVKETKVDVDKEAAPDRGR